LSFEETVPAYKVSFAYPERLFPPKEMFYDVEGFLNLGQFYLYKE
jgi:hypothetical protein